NNTQACSLRGLRPRGIASEPELQRQNIHSLPSAFRVCLLRLVGMILQRRRVQRLDS
ncbi:hypothetical protein A2U01_0091054, partial [Trifolium medium]|nr:hypothetical protein [Trifolium medium]